jgi:Cu/Ag efflux pump CusA
MLISTYIAIGAFLISALSLYLSYKKYTFDKKVYIAEQVAKLKTEILELIMSVKKYKNDFIKSSEQIIIKEIDYGKVYSRNLPNKNMITLIKRINELNVKQIKEKEEIDNEFAGMLDKYEDLYSRVGKGSIDHDPIKWKSVEVDIRRLPPLISEANEAAKRWIDRHNELNKIFQEYRHLLDKGKRSRSKKSGKH